MPHASDCLKVYRIKNPAANDNMTNVAIPPARSHADRFFAVLIPSARILSLFVG